MTVHNQQKRRLLIAASSFSDAEAALPLVTPLLEFTPAHLAGLLSGNEVADLVLMEGQQIVSSRGSLFSVPSQSQSRGFGAGDARAFKKLLAKVAGARSVSWTFEAGKSDLIASVCATATIDDIVLLGHRPISRFHGRVLLIGQERTQTGAARSMAEALARALATVVTEIHPDDREAVESILARVDQSHASLVVADFKTGPLRSEADLRLLFGAARCPVAVLGAGAIRQPREDPTLADTEGA